MPGCEGTSCCASFAMTTPLEKALATIVITFHKYSGKEGDKFKLNKAELKDLLLNELPAFNSKRMDAAEFQKIMGDLDHNKDNEVDFQEFTCFLACVSMGFDEFFRGCPKPPLPKK
ncbi:protein S100-A4-like isoform X1 [Sceloporus undulatus]|uniref:protein S100-A4-like isoform X1 n=2 Tax=Sceloporus undulatus TaxID=8520 RepID=UPI001C4C89F2|nr:protein S100-A4-like isoform X1 [Sceloporus undulatus]